MSDTKTIVLRKPLTYGKGADEKSVTEITLREPLAGDYEAAERSAGVFGTSIALVAIISGVPVDVIDQMYGSQIDEAEDFIASFGHDAARNPTASPDEILLTLSKPVQLTTDDSPLNIASLSLGERCSGCDARVVCAERIRCRHRRRVHDVGQRRGRARRVPAGYRRRLSV
ncbi:phage tail assembly protein [Burkholderia thailandensis]|uniref:phage tail assembly protein n=1 Tax=Burkholderia thailandensis TaxID=57975 RepID=UPI00016A28A5|nr:phage tail assembly protein [Burkholderia thailandensis]